MPVIRDIDDLPARHGTGWSERAWAGPAVLGAAVPMEASRWVINPGAASPAVVLGAPEAMLYVAAGAGTADVSGERFALGPESVLWLAACPEVVLHGGPDGLDALIARGSGHGVAGGQALAKLFAAAELPHLVSTRDTRDRLDLITESVPVGARQIRADRIIYHPGDTAAAHFHADCHHVFCVLAGAGLLCTDQEVSRLTAGMSALVGPGEVHWFVNDTDANFSFVEFWAPPPTDTVWTVAGDRCTWAPAS
ncbi:MAG TPA: cupin domain-containing protein [Streptosporangiaceae bacterium]|nr:cupin domain-containing protein [Streptosporangiaceae bacterium]